MSYVHVHVHLYTSVAELVEHSSREQSIMGTDQAYFSLKNALGVDLYRVYIIIGCTGYDIIG